MDTSVVYHNRFVTACRDELVGSVAPADQDMARNLTGALMKATSFDDWDHLLDRYLSPLLDLDDVDSDQLTIPDPARREPLLSLYHCLRGGYRLVCHSDGSVLPRSSALAAHLVAILPGLDKETATRYATLAGADGRLLEGDVIRFTEAVEALLAAPFSNIWPLEPLLSRWRSESVSMHVEYLDKVRLTTPQVEIYAQLVADRVAMTEAMTVARVLA